MHMIVCVITLLEADVNQPVKSFCLSNADSKNTNFTGLNQGDDSLSIIHKIPPCPQASGRLDLDLPFTVDEQKSRRVKVT